MPEEVDIKPVMASSNPSPPPSGAKTEPIEVLDDDDPDVKPKDVDLDAAQVAQAKNRHEADLKKHHYVPPVADRLQDDWQVAYVWAFIVKFQQINHIRKLECLDDFERCLIEPVANRPDDVFEGILIRFLSNLKPGLRGLNCTNIQLHLSKYIENHVLTSPEFTVWDRPWAPNEEARASCCTDAPDRQEWGRLQYPGEPIEERAKKNPIFQAEQRGGGLFELDWVERAKLLRQLVDWQLTHADNIRGIIHKEYKINDVKAKAVDGLSTSIQISPLGLDRTKGRIWSFDASGRIYRSGNPFKRPCPLETITHNRTEVLAYHDDLKSYTSQTPKKPEGSGPKGKLTPAEVVKHRKIVKGVEDETALVGEIEKLLPEIEKEEARVQRARKKIAATIQASQLAELRTTRTRRPTRQVNYANLDGGISESDAEDDRPNKRQKNGGPSWEGSSTRGKLVVPGERRSARVGAKDEVSVPPPSALADHSNGTLRANGKNGEAEGHDEDDTGAGKKKRGMKGWAWVEEDVTVPDEDVDMAPASEPNGTESERRTADALGGAETPTVKEEEVVAGGGPSEGQG